MQQKMQPILSIKLRIFNSITHIIKIHLRTNLNIMSSILIRKWNSENFHRKARYRQGSASG
jgi:hypothetical protein